MRLVMLETPYQAQDRTEAIRYACWCVYDSMTRGEAPFVSHLLYTQILPETDAGRALGLAARDAWSHGAATLVAKYVDLGISPGMVRDVDCTLPIEERKLGGLIRAAWKKGEWPKGSARLCPVP
jgi:hypothetical protein